MAGTNDCIPCCSGTAVTTNVPGSTGASAVTTTTASFVVPAVGSTVAISVTDTTWMYASSSVGTNLWIAGGNFMVTSVGGSTSVTVMFLGLDNDTVVAGNTIVSGSVVAAGIGAYKLSVALSAVANFTDNTGGSVSSTLAAGAGIYVMTVPWNFVTSTSAIDVMSNIIPGHRFKILSWQWTDGGTVLVGASGSRVANMEIGSTDVGTVASTITITQAGTATGRRIAGTAVSGANVGTASDSLSIEIAAGGTDITAGNGSFHITIQNMDSADAFASIVAKWAVLTGLLGKP